VNDTLKLDKRGRLRAAGPVLVPLRRAPGGPVHVASVAAVRTVSTGSAPAHAAKAASSTRWYVVKSGDTLYDIARRFDTEVEALRSLNRLSSRAILRPGFKLRVPQAD